MKSFLIWAYLKGSKSQKAATYSSATYSRRSQLFEAERDSEGCDIVEYVAAFCDFGPALSR